MIGNAIILMLELKLFAIAYKHTLYINFAIENN